ncbi:IPK1 [Candida pseudojiufengensis]|uniref:IPK1 n=1 Tax=Candida pseudojiufengensis TaxID=497109 RepID=UPI002224C022|nr:IPK1 [Candida pseudojiufengensis]KAI5965788.1 IPK1 [Candida pseudojiufengensis]
MEIYKITSPKEWKYFAKGAANILFKYTGSNDYLRHKLLRLRLNKRDEEYISTCELYDFIELKCKKLFPNLIIDIQLIVLTFEFISELNKLNNLNNEFELNLNERYGLLLPNILDGDYIKLSSSKHCQLYFNNSLTSQEQFNINNNNNSSIRLNNQENGKIINYTPDLLLNPSIQQNKINSIIFEIKPKWLYDNKSQNYCRTCSLNQLNNYKRHFCPLDLLYEETYDTVIEDIFSKIPPELLNLIEQTNDFPIKLLFKIFLQNESKNIFLKLKKYQKINNKNDLIENLSNSNDVSKNLSLVMTLRDVGIFIKFEKFNKFNNIHNSHNNIDNTINLKDFEDCVPTTTTNNSINNNTANNGIEDDEIIKDKYLITCNIYDLDLKSKNKYKYWIKIENDLKKIYNSENKNWKYCIKH